MFNFKKSLLLLYIASIPFIFNFTIAQVTFTDVTASAGTGLGEGTSRAIAWVDFNNDGLYDLSLPTSGSFTNKFYMNNGNGTFTEIATILGLNDPANTITCSWADYDNDGDMDEVTTATAEATRLWRNNRETITDTTFTSVEVAAGIVQNAGQMVGWADYNKDGFVDFYSPVSNSATAPDVLYMNNGNGTFTNMSTAAGVNNQISGILEQGVHWGDFNKDGFPELWVGTITTGGQSYFYVNNGNGTFTQSASLYGFTPRGRGAQWIDFNNDGLWDFCLASYEGGTNPVPVKLFKNNGNGTFTNIASSAGLTENLMAWGLTCADYDNNGYEDIFVYCSGQSTTCKLYKNNGNETFTEVIGSSGIGASLIQLQAGWGDFNNDGWLDLYTSGSTTNGNHLFKNNGGLNNHWMQINLVGDSTNKAGINAQIDVKSGSLRMMREINTAIGYRSQNQIRAHFGLGSNLIVDSIFVRWPSGWTDVLTNVPADNIITVTEYQTIPVELVSFSANIIDNKVHLSWETATELNNSGFEILRQATQEINWQKIGFVPGFGTTTEPHSYLFIDDIAVNGKYNYRLKQLDNNGIFNYSNIIEVTIEIPFEFSLEQNYPNPFNPNTTIKYAIGGKQFVQIKVYDILGNEVAELVNKETPAGTYEVEFVATEIPSGVYFYKLQAGEFIQTKKMILLK